MELPPAKARTVAPDDSEERRASTSLIIKRIRKLRWIGMDDEANLLKAELASCDVATADTVLAEPRDTD
jgi:hypothetical protein